MTGAAPELPGLLVKSLVMYSIVEAQAGHATQIGVTVQGPVFAMWDNGRGHAAGRQVQGHPYLQLIYGQLDFPFGAPQGPPVQLQGIATSLIRALCSDFSVSFTRDGRTHRLGFEAGGIVMAEQPAAPGSISGNRVEGRLHPALPCTQDDAALAAWLAEVARAVPGLQLQFNGQWLR